MTIVSKEEPHRRGGVGVKESGKWGRGNAAGKDAQECGKRSCCVCGGGGGRGGHHARWSVYSVKQEHLLRDGSGELRPRRAWTDDPEQTGAAVLLFSSVECVWGIYVCMLYGVSVHVVWCVCSCVHVVWCVFMLWCVLAWSALPFHLGQPVV